MKTILVSILYGQEEKNEKVEFGFDETGFYLLDHPEPGKTGQHFPFHKNYTLRELQQYRRTHYAVVDTAKNLFPDWDEIPVGQWSLHGFSIDTDNNDEINQIEFGLFHEWETSNYSFPTNSVPKKDITLNIFMGNDVIFCHSILL